jgi:DNA-binding beta-propeller fold protein YncE
MRVREVIGVSRVLVAIGLVASTVTIAGAQEFEFRVIARGLSRPVGIAAEGSGVLYFTQVPTPGVAGGQNGVFRLELASGAVETVHLGEPEPTNIAIDREGTIYWTCKSAGVILAQMEDSTTTLLTGLEFPSGIAVGRNGNVYFTELPMPGVPGAGNRVSVFDGSTKTVLHMGDPEPTDIVVRRNGALYWTCKSAGVILAQVGGVTTVLAAGLDHPTGIAIDHKGTSLYFTEVPTPGVSGSNGGRNAIKALDLRTREITTIDEGDPEPTDITVARNGNLYWTCTSAGVIVEAKRRHRR